MILLQAGPFYAQDLFSLNLGGTAQSHYFSVLAYKEVKSKIIVQCSINGRPHNFILDTGAATTISQALFKELRPNVLTSLPVSDQAGIVDSLQIASLPNIQLGNVVFKDIPAIVATDPMIFDCFEVDGLLGSNLLRNSIVQFSSVKHTVTITDDAKRLGLNKKYAAKMELSVTQSSPFIMIDIQKGKTTGRDVVLFDSGMDSFYDLSMAAYQKVFDTVDLFTVMAEATGSFTMGMNGVLGDRDYYKVNAPELLINGSTFKNVVTETTYGDSSRIGAYLFKYGTVTLDYKNRKFYFEPYKPGTPDLSKDDWPFTPTVKDKKLVVGIVWGRQWDGIIVPGDEIIQFDGKNYEGKDICEVLKTTHESADVVAKVILRDALTGEIKELEVSKE